MPELGARAAERLRSELFLHAVLPALEDLVVVSEEARALCRGWRRTIRLRVLKGASATLRFDEGTVRVAEEEGIRPTVDLMFLSPAQLNAAFTGERRSVPLLRRGWSRIGQIKDFIRLTAILRRHLEPDPERLADEAFLSAHVRLLLRVAVFGLGPLARHEPWTKAELVEFGDTSAEFRLEAQGYSLHAQAHDGRIGARAGRPARRADAEILFTTDVLALQALHGRLDRLAAIGREELRINGQIPLAQTLEQAMERLQRYLPVGVILSAR